MAAINFAVWEESGFLNHPRGGTAATKYWGQSNVKLQQACIFRNISDKGGKSIKYEL